MKTRYRFYCSLETFDAFEAHLKLLWSISDASFTDVQGRPHILVPMQTGVEDWPVLIGTDEVPVEEQEEPA